MCHIIKQVMIFNSMDTRIYYCFIAWYIHVCHVTHSLRQWLWCHLILLLTECMYYDMLYPCVSYNIVIDSDIDVSFNIVTDMVYSLTCYMCIIWHTARQWHRCVIQYCYWHGICSLTCYICIIWHTVRQWHRCVIWYGVCSSDGNRKEFHNRSSVSHE
jgi:hypothetical protein